MKKARYFNEIWRNNFSLHVSDLYVVIHKKWHKYITCIKHFAIICLYLAKIIKIEISKAIVKIIAKDKFGDYQILNVMHFAQVIAHI